jgi:phytoene synthase
MSAPTERPRTTIADAYAACEQITRTEAKNFYYGIRLLRPDKRSALCALYALARRIDDIGDGDLPRAAKTDALSRLRARLGHAAAGDDPVLLAVSDAARRYPVPIAAFGEMIDGVQQDVDGVRYADFAALTGYCRCVAGTVGRLCLSIFGSGEDPNATLYADQLGIALQQTNILRDIREDLINGRVYLPADELDRFGIHLELDTSGALVDPDGRLAALIRQAADRAENWYCLGWRLVPQLDSRSAACCAAMAGIYRRLNDRIKANPVAVYDRRLSLTGLEKSRVASGTLLRSSATALTDHLRPGRRAPQLPAATSPTSGPLTPQLTPPRIGRTATQFGTITATQLRITADASIAQSRTDAAIPPTAGLPHQASHAAETPGSGTNTAAPQENTVAPQFGAAAPSGGVVGALAETAAPQMDTAPSDTGARKSRDVR